MPEAFVWTEGSIALWTGSASPSTSAVLAYAQNMNGVMQRGWFERQSIDGEYFRHLTGQSFDLTVQAVYTYDATIVRMVESATAVHLKLQHNNVNGSAGFLVYSGHVAALSPIGSEANPYTYSLTYRANLWSAYGG